MTSLTPEQLQDLITDIRNLGKTLETARFQLGEVKYELEDAQRQFTTIRASLEPLNAEGDKNDK